MSLSHFILDEGLKSKQVLTLHRFNELYRDQVMLDLHDRLIKIWAKIVKGEHARLTKDEAEEALLKNDLALISCVLSHGPIKAHIGNQTVSPSVKIPLTLPVGKRNLLEKTFLDETETCFLLLLSHWAEAFMFERNSGKLASDFKVKRNDQSVRIVIAGGDGLVTHESTICYVSIERGKSNTKTKAYDLVCLRTS